MRALHQAAIDQGECENASLLLPKPDPIKKPVFGGTQAELDSVAAYRESLRKFEAKRGAGAGGKGEGKKKSGDGGE